MKKYTKKHKGGKVIDSGGFGCVFIPALKCRNNKTRTKGISKLSFANETNIEWNKLTTIKKYLSKIPNYSKYFLIKDITTCNPDKLSILDKKSFDKCFLLENNGITISNINDNLHLLKIINMPYGGINLDLVVNNDIISINNYNKLLQNLLINAIIPMNRLKLYHFDIKSSNILYKDNNIKIIDFGEIGISLKNKIIPNILFNRGIQFNSPFSRILYTDFIDNYLSIAFIKYKIKNNTSDIKKLNIMKQIYREYIKKFGLAHEIYLSKFLLPQIFNLMPNNLIIDILGVSINNINYESILSDWITNYCFQVVKLFFNYKTMKLDRVKYFEEVYSKNVDIYGLISCYIPFIMTNNYNYTKDLKIKISNILIKYCFNSKYAIKPIPINLLISDLNKI